MRQQGVTLIQLTGVLALLAILTQLAVPAYSDWREATQHAVVARELAQTLRSARTRALLGSQRVIVEPLGNDWGRGWQTVVGADRKMLREHRLQRPLSITTNLTEVWFSPLGIPQRENGAFAGGTLQVCPTRSRNPPQRIVLAPSGRVSLRSGDALDAPGCAPS